VAGVAVDAGDASGGGFELAAIRSGVAAHQPQVEGGVAAVVGDLQHVVLVWFDPAGANRFGPGDEGLDVVGQLFAGGHDHDGGAVVLDLGEGEGEVVADADIGGAAGTER
jgi:hypothetical protein